MHKGKTNLAFYYSQPAPREFNLSAVGMRPAAYRSLDRNKNKRRQHALLLLPQKAV
jgi:hypothetical protein